MNKIVLLCATFCCLAVAAFAQYPVKQSMLPLFAAVPEPSFTAHCDDGTLRAKYEAFQAQCTKVTEQIVANSSHGTGADQIKQYQKGIKKIERANEKAAKVDDDLNNDPKTAAAYADLQREMSDPAVQQRMQGMSEGQQKEYIKNFFIKRGVDVSKYKGDMDDSKKAHDDLGDLSEGKVVRVMKSYENLLHNFISSGLMTMRYSEDAHGKIDAAIQNLPPFTPCSTPCKACCEKQKAHDIKVAKAAVAVYSANMQLYYDDWAAARDRTKTHCSDFDGVLRDMKYGDAMTEDRDKIAIPTLVSGQGYILLAAQGIGEKAQDLTSVATEYCEAQKKLADITATVCADCEGCFPADALVLLADGTQKPIADVKLGEVVMAYNTHTHTWQPTPVTHIDIHNGDFELCQFTVEPLTNFTASNGGIYPSVASIAAAATTTITATANHPIYTCEGYTRVDALTQAHTLLIHPLDSDKQVTATLHDTNAHRTRTTTVYNLHTALHNYCVEGVVVGDKE